MNAVFLSNNCYLIFNSGIKKLHSFIEKKPFKNDHFYNRNKINLVISHINNLFRRIKGITTPDIFTLFHAVEYDCNEGIFVFIFHNTTSSSLYINRPCQFIFNPSPPISGESDTLTALNLILQKFKCKFHFYSNEILAWNRVKHPVDEYTYQQFLLNS